MDERVSALVTLPFTDVVGSTELLTDLGDDAAEEVRRAHFGLLRQAVSETGGTKVKSLGDGLMVVFPSAGWVLDKSAAARATDEMVGAQLAELAGQLCVCPVGELGQLYSARSARR